MMLWISSISGSPESSIPTSFSTGIRRSPNASNCSRESQISLPRRFPFDLKATWYASPSGSQSPDFSRRLRVSSYCSVVTSDAGVKRARIAVLRASMVGVADGLVAIHGLLRVDAPDRADLQPNASCCARLAGEDSGPESTTQRITLLVQRRRFLPSDDYGGDVLLQGRIYSVERRCKIAKIDTRLGLFFGRFLAPSDGKRSRDCHSAQDAARLPRARCPPRQT